MHGRPREYKNKLKSDPKAQESYKKKVDAIRNGTALVLEYRRQRKYDPAILDASAKLLKVVPEIYTLWNYRREALEPVFAAGGEAAQKASDGELALTQVCLLENPKSYSTWHHRKWVVTRGLAPLEKELALVARALDGDQRNFHAWNYRQFVCGRMGRSPEEELSYVEEKILQNFSNYSAWHFRTMLLHRMYCGAGPGGQPHEGGEAAGGPGPEGAPAAGGADVGAGGSASQRTPLPHDVLDQEYDMVHQAFATDARDESPWMYYRWLVGNTLAHLGGGGGAGEVRLGLQQDQHAEPQPTTQQEGAAPPPSQPQPQPGAGTGGSAAGPAAGAGGVMVDVAAPGHGGAGEDEERLRVGAVLAREAARMREEHLAAESDAKWPLLTLARLLEAQARLNLAGTPEECARALEEARELYGKLMLIDPMRRGYYQDALEGRAFVVVQALWTV